MTSTSRTLRWLARGAFRIPDALAVAAVVATCSIPARAQSGATPVPAWSPRDSLSVFVGLEGSKEPQDLGINANMGPRVAVNFGAPIARAHGLGVQVGVASNLSDAAVHVLDQIDGTSRRTQTFVSIAVFQRAADRLSWSVGYDHLFEQYYDHVSAGQVRGELHYIVSKTTAVGVVANTGVRGFDAVAAGTPVRLDAITQVSGVYRRTWPSRAQTALWVGVTGGHHNVVWVFPDSSETGHVVVYGADLRVPLSDRVALTGAANLVTPTATGTVDAFLGLTFYPGAHLMSGRTSRAMPVSDVANNTSFPLDLRR